MKTTAQSYYDNGALDQIRSCIRNGTIRQALKHEHCFRELWEAITHEADIADLSYYYMAKKRQYAGCVGEMTAQDALDYIHENRDKKAHELGECYK